MARKLTHVREVVAGLVRTARIFMEQGRYAEADARYDEALDAARRAGDKELEAKSLQHHGDLAERTGQHGRAAERYERALELFQDAGNEVGVMQTCNLLGVVERRCGRLSEARAWYERSREIAERRGDVESVGIVAQNLGIVCQEEGQAAQEDRDEAGASQRFAEAERYLQESLRIKKGIGNKKLEATAWGQLGQLYVLTGELDRAEDHARRGCEIDERLGLTRQLALDYETLARIARARGDATQTAAWEAKRDEVVAELRRRAVGGGEGQGGARVPDQLVRAIMAVAGACVRAGIDGSGVPAEVEGVLSQMAADDSPLKGLAAVLREMAGGKIPGSADALPADLPGPLRELLGRLIDAANEARGSS